MTEVEELKRDYEKRLREGTNLLEQKNLNPYFMDKNKGQESYMPPRYNNDHSDMLTSMITVNSRIILDHLQLHREG